MTSRALKLLLTASLVVNVFLLGSIAGGTYQWLVTGRPPVAAAQQRGLRFAAQETGRARTPGRAGTALCGTGRRQVRPTRTRPEAAPRRAQRTDPDCHRAGAILVAPRIAFAHVESEHRFVFQRGAADGLNTVIPYADPAYARLRGPLAIAASAAPSTAAACWLTGRGWELAHFIKPAT